MILPEALLIFGCTNQSAIRKPANIFAIRRVKAVIVVKAQRIGDAKRTDDREIQVLHVASPTGNELGLLQ